MALKGNFETFYLNSILQLLHNDKKTGVFRATNGTDEVTIYFSDGAVIHAMGSKREARLGYLLKMKGLISTEQLKKCLVSAKEKKQALGKYLVENGYITVDDLNIMLAKQTEEILLNLFQWEKGEFEYKDAQLNLKGLVNISINVMKIILEASRRIDEMSIFKKQIPTTNTVFKISEDIRDREEIKLNAAELRLLTLIDGKKNVAEIFQKGGYDTFTDIDQFGAYKILHSLISSGLVEKHGGDQPEDGMNAIDANYISIVTIYNEVLQAIFKSLELELGKKIFNILDDCKSEIVTRPINLFKGFHPDNPATTNVHSILKVMKGYEENETHKKLLIKSANQFIMGLLDKVVHILGRQLTRHIMQETEKILSHFKQHHPFNEEAVSPLIDNLIGALQSVGQQDQPANRAN